MLGHLPMRYQVAIWLVGLVASTGTGAWVAWSTAVPVVPASGAVIGALLGIAVVGAFVHTFGSSPDEAPAHH